MEMSARFGDNAQFVARVTIIHVCTYILCGMVFSTLFDYGTLFKAGNAVYFMRSMDSTSVLIGPCVQILRGVLFGLVLLLFRNSYEGRRYGWLRLWAIILVLGIIDTPGPAPCSIEGVVYTQLPIEFHIKGAPEILVQTLLFSWLVARPKNNRRVVSDPRKRCVIAVAVIAAVGFSLGGIILTLILGVDVMVGVSDPWAFLVMFAAIAIVAAMTLWYVKRPRKTLSSVCYYLVGYVVLAVIPTVYNFCTGSPLSSWWSLLISALPLVMLGPYVETVKRNLKKL